MKKLVFAALAAVFVLSSGFSTLDEKDSLLEEDFGNCNFTVTETITGPDGETTEITTDYSYWTLSLESCVDRARGAIAGIGLAGGSASASGTWQQ